MFATLEHATEMMTDGTDFERSFHNMWERNTDRYGFFHLALFVAPQMTSKELEDGWKRRVVRIGNYEIAKQEFIRFMCGAW